MKFIHDPVRGLPSLSGGGGNFPLPVFFGADAELFFEDAGKVILIPESAAIGNFRDGVIVFDRLVKVFDGGVQPLLQQKLGRADAVILDEEPLQIALGIGEFLIDGVQIEEGVSEIGNDFHLDDFGGYGNVGRLDRRIDEGEQKIDQIVDDILVGMYVMKVAIGHVEDVVQIVHVVEFGIFEIGDEDGFSVSRRPVHQGQVDIGKSRVREIPMEIQRRDADDISGVVIDAVSVLKEKFSASGNYIDNFPIIVLVQPEIVNVRIFFDKMNGRHSSLR